MAAAGFRQTSYLYWIYSSNKFRLGTTIRTVGQAVSSIAITIHSIPKEKLLCLSTLLLRQVAPQEVAAARRLARQLPAAASGRPVAVVSGPPPPVGVVPQVCLRRRGCGHLNTLAVAGVPGARSTGFSLAGNDVLPCRPPAGLHGAQDEVIARDPPPLKAFRALRAVPGRGALRFGVRFPVEHGRGREGDATASLLAVLLGLGQGGEGCPTHRLRRHRRRPRSVRAAL
ncbi:unnamed protein product, partial [Heterosigma akashiwo]